MRYKKLQQIPAFRAPEIKCCADLQHCSVDRKTRRVRKHTLKVMWERWHVLNVRRDERAKMSPGINCNFPVVYLISYNFRNYP